MLLSLLVVVVSGGASAELAPTLAWPLTGISVTATDSFKWVVRIVPDGAGGAVVAWEENRGRRVCCRDTRDLYAQRLDASGQRIWGAEDIKVAGEEPGEELLGIAPAGKGGALLFWRRGRGTLLAQEFDGNGKALDGPGGTIVHNAGEACEWPQLTGFAVTPRASRACLIWTEGEMPRTSSIMGMVASSVASGRWLVTPPRALLTQPGLHAAAVVACGEARWCLVWWSRTDAGITVGGLMLAADGAPQGKPFIIGSDPDLQYGHAEAVAAGPDRVYVIWGAVHPEHVEQTHALHAAVVTMRTRGKPKVSGVVVGQARSQVMFIPPTEVQIGAGAPIAATAPVVAWRQTSALTALRPVAAAPRPGEAGEGHGAAAGSAGAVVAWLDGKGLQATGMRVVDDRLSVTPSVEISADANAGFSPLVAPVGSGSVLAVWAAQTGGHVRASGRLLRLRGAQLEFAGDSLVLAEGAMGLPRVGSSTPAYSGGVVLAWNALGGGEHGSVVAQRVMISPP